MKTKWYYSVVCVFTLMAIMISTQNVFSAQTGYGTISGTVTGPGPDGIKGIPNVGVGISDKFSQVIPYGWTSTDNVGYYSIDVPVGTEYKVRFSPPQGNGFDGNYYFSQWYLDGINYSPYFESAQYVAVNDGVITDNINTTLTRGGAVSGRVTDMNTTPNPLPNVGVWAIDKYGWWISGNGTDGNGEYLVNVPAGIWTIQFGPSNEAGYIINEWFDNKPYRDLADPVTVDLGTITPGINAQLETGGAISGRVTGPGGIGLANIIIDATDANGMWVNGTGTNALGYYHFNILAGDYKVRFGTHFIPGNYVGEWYSNGDLVHVDLGQTTQDINAELQIGATISGTVTDEYDAPLSLVQVNAMDTSGNRLGFTGATTDILGNYTIIVPAGEWRLNFDPWRLEGYYFQEYHDNKINQSNANHITVNVGGAITLPNHQKMIIGGKITGKVTANNNPVANVNVGVVDANGRWLYGTRTDINGNYSITAPAGSYRIELDPSLAGGYYLRGWYDNENPVTVEVGKSNTLSPFPLSTGGAISGRVTDSSPQGNGIANVNVSYCDFSNSGNICYGGTNTDANGDYTLVAPAGLWKIQFYPQQGTGYYLPKWHNNQSSSTNAQDVLFESGTTKTGYNAQLEMGGAISGKVTNPETIGIANANVGYCDSTGYCFGWTNTNYLGEYTLIAPVGKWTVRFDPPSGGGYYLREWYNNWNNSNNANTVSVSAGLTTPDINAQLEIGGIISGRVTDSSPQGNGIANVDVSPVDSSNNWLIGARTNSSGYYSITVPSGSYKIKFNPWVAGYYAPEWYNDQVYQNDAYPIAVNKNQTYDNVNAVLAAGGKISGRVTDSNRIGLANVNVNVSVNVNNSSVWVNGNRTDSQGDYSIPVAPGTYKVQFSPTDPNYVMEWYDHKPGFSSAVDVTVTDNLTTAINPTLATYQTLTISGRVTDSSGTAGIADVTMNGLSGRPKTDANGYYTGTVTYAWSPTWTGDIIPGKNGYIFTPAYNAYKNINTNQTNQVFSGSMENISPGYYDQFSGTDLDPSKWNNWQIREIITDFDGERKFFSKTAAYGSTAGNRLDFKNPLTINHIEADVVVTEIDGNYGPNTNGQVAAPEACLAGLFYNDGKGSTVGWVSYLGEVLAKVCIQPNQLVSTWSVIKYINQAGTEWTVLGSGTLGQNLTQGQSYRLSLNWDGINTFTFGDGVVSAPPFQTPDSPQTAKIGWKALRTQVNIADPAHGSVKDPALWGKISTTFDNVKACQNAPCSAVYDDFSSAKLDATKWAAFEQNVKEMNGQLILDTRNANPKNRMQNQVTFINPDQVNEIQAKVTIQEFQSASGSSPMARMGGIFFNDTGDPNSGYRGDVFAQVALQGGVPVWTVLRFNDSIASQWQWQILGQGTFPLTIDPGAGATYNLYLKWDGVQFIFKCDEYAAYYIPSAPIYQPNNPTRFLGTVVNPPTNQAAFDAYIKAAFDDVVVNGKAQFTPTGPGIISRPMDPNTGATPSTLTFSQVTQAGMTSLSTSTQGPAIPAGFQLGNPPVYYEISTTAGFTGSINVAINYNGVQYINETSLRLLHFESGAWVDCTTSVDTAKKIIYGTVNSLSPFILVEPIPNRPPVIQSVTANPGTLWPPNKKPVNVTITVIAYDPEGAGDIVRTTYSVADEYGQYNVPETNLPSNGVISLIADRDGKDKDGRVYTITVKVYDKGGLSATKNITVVVPHDERDDDKNDDKNDDDKNDHKHNDKKDKHDDNRDKQQDDEGNKKGK